MRYLNKVIFIESANTRYAEIKLDGNVHQNGTQVVGKSTCCGPCCSSTMRTSKSWASRLRKSDS